MNWYIVTYEANDGDIWTWRGCAASPEAAVVRAQEYARLSCRPERWFKRPVLVEVDSGQPID